MTDRTIDRRTVLKLTGAATLGGVGAASTASGQASKRPTGPDTVVEVHGRKKRKYLNEAVSSVTEEDAYAGLRHRLAERAYEVTSDDAIVTETIHGYETSVTVFLPLVTDGEPVGSLSADHPDSTPNRHVFGRFGHVVWKEDEPAAVFAIVTGDTETLLPEAQVSSESAVALATSGIEIVRPDSHTIELSTEFDGTKSPSATESPGRLISIDVDSDTIDVSRATTADTRSNETCPTSIPVILGTLAACGGSCTKCASLSIGNPTAIFACIGCAGCGCGLGCCLGERSSSLCTAASSYLALPGFIRDPGTSAGAICVREGCDDKTCL